MTNSYPIPDESLRSDILAALMSDEHTAQINVRVGVLNGIAHLAGQVDTLEMREAVEELVGKVAGVRGVVNRIEAPGAPSPARQINLDLSKAN